MKAGKALKRVKDYGRASLKTFTTKQLPPIYSNWKKQKSVTGRDGTGLDDVGTAELESKLSSLTTITYLAILVAIVAVAIAAYGLMSKK